MLTACWPVGSPGHSQCTVCLLGHWAVPRNEIVGAAGRTSPGWGSQVKAPAAEADGLVDARAFRPQELLSALIGIAVHEGQIDLDTARTGSGIDDVDPARTDLERQATGETG